MTRFAVLAISQEMVYLFQLLKIKLWNQILLWLKTPGQVKRMLSVLRVTWKEKFYLKRAVSVKSATTSMKNCNKRLQPKRSEKRNKRKKIVKERLKSKLIECKRRKSVLRRRLRIKQFGNRRRMSVLRERQNKKPFKINRIRSVVREMQQLKLKKNLR